METRPYNGSSRTPTPTHEIECIHPYKPQIVILSEAKDLKTKYKMFETRFFA